MVRAAFDVDASGAARWLMFRLAFCLLSVSLLIAGFPAVLDLRQDFPHSLNVSFTPEANSHTSHFHDGRKRDFLVCNVPIESRETDAKLSSSFAGGASKHSIMTIIK